ncbi:MULTISPECIES: DUF3558 family protein [unclassified Actinopolyspora]|uniref:DUF3558 family protein n=1 Tax=unclassified Actinopolyspora TaxID=2639451 RepID=UPI0013F644CA|nr:MULTISPECIES: DUF3558 family protein [unclassified Actinopolyspora]NHD18649.1 DUF3558 family protein [Actinopolyspora sp. BKK2]NHE78029.1 DUF3558 family protein [Actinopolyspora sp. BKK1]
MHVPARMRRGVVAALGLVTAMTVSSACSAASSEEAPPPPPKTSAGDPVLSGLSPCDALKPQQERSLGAASGGTSEDVDDPSTCSWQLADGSTSVSLHPRKSLRQIDFPEAYQRPHAINDSGGRLVISKNSDTCTVAISVNPSESISVDAEGSGGTNSCDLANEVAPLVERNIPES